MTNESENMTSQKKIILNDYQKMLYYFTKYGDLLVIGLSIVENFGDSQAEVSLDGELVKSSLRYLMKRHPLLRAHVVEEIADGERKVYLNIADDNDEQMNITQEDLAWKNISSRDGLMSELEEFNSKKLDYSSKCKLWRASVYEFTEDDKRKYAIAFLLPLYITDALNITALSIEIVNIINAQLLHIECEEMKSPLNVEADVYTLTERDNLIGNEQHQKMNHINSNLNKRFKFDEYFKRANEQGSKINMFKVDEPTTSRLISLTKTKNIKFTGFLMTCLFYSLKQLYDEHGIQMPEEIVFGVSANLRFRLKTNVDYSSIGYFSSLATIETEYPKFGRYDDVWSDAAYLNELICEYTDTQSGAVFSDLYGLESIRSTNELFEATSDLRQIVKGLEPDIKWDIIASNIGTYLINSKEQNPSRPFQIKEIYFSDTLNSNPPIDTSFLVHLTFWHGQLMFMISSNKSGIDSVHVDRLVELFEKTLLKF